MNRITLMGFTCAVGMSVVTVFTWFVAYLNPLNMVTVYINRFGEMYLELILVPLIFIFIIITCLYEWKQYSKELK